MKSVKLWGRIFPLMLVLICALPSWAEEGKAAENKKDAKAVETVKPAKDVKAAEAAKPAKDDKAAKEKIAVVNGTIITRGDFNQEMAPIEQRLKTQQPAADETQLADVRKKVLDEMVRREIMWQESQKKGFKITDAEVEERLTQFKAGFPDEEQFKKGLESMGISEDVIRHQIRQQEAIQKLVEQEVVQKIVISDAETKAYYDENPDFFKVPEQVKASHILIKTEASDDAAKKAEARKKIEDIQKKLRDGGDFEALAKEFSGCPSAPKGGDLGYFGKGQMVKPFETAAFGLEVGKISDIVETQFGYHIIKVTDRKAPSVRSYDEVKERIGNVMKRNKTRDDVEKYIERLKSDAKVEMFM